MRHRPACGACFTGYEHRGWAAYALAFLAVGRGADLSRYRAEDLSQAWTLVNLSTIHGKDPGAVWLAGGTESDIACRALCAASAECISYDWSEGTRSEESGGNGKPCKTTHECWLRRDGTWLPQQGNKCHKRSGHRGELDYDTASGGASARVCILTHDDVRCTPSALPQPRLPAASSSRRQTDTSRTAVVEPGLAIKYYDGDVAIGIPNTHKPNGKRKGGNVLTKACGEICAGIASCIWFSRIGTACYPYSKLYNSLMPSARPEISGNDRFALRSMAGGSGAGPGCGDSMEAAMSCGDVGAGWVDGPHRDVCRPTNLTVGSPQLVLECSSVGDRARFTAKAVSLFPRLSSAERAALVELRLVRNNLGSLLAITI